MLATLASPRTLLPGIQPFAHGKSLCHGWFTVANVASAMGPQRPLCLGQVQVPGRVVPDQAFPDGGVQRGPQRRGLFLQ